MVDPFSSLESICILQHKKVAVHLQKMRFITGVAGSEEASSAVPIIFDLEENPCGDYTKHLKPAVFEGDFVRLGWRTGFVQ